VKETDVYLESNSNTNKRKRGQGLDSHDTDLPPPEKKKVASSSYNSGNETDSTPPNMFDDFFTFDSADANKNDKNRDPPVKMKCRIPSNLNLSPEDRGAINATMSNRSPQSTGDLVGKFKNMSPNSDLNSEDFLSILNKLSPLSSPDSI